MRPMRSPSLEALGRPTGAESLLLPMPRCPSHPWWSRGRRQPHPGVPWTPRIHIVPSGGGPTDQRPWTPSHAEPAPGFCSGQGLQGLRERATECSLHAKLNACMCFACAHVCVCMQAHSPLSPCQRAPVYQLHPLPLIPSSRTPVASKGPGTKFSACHYLAGPAIPWPLTEARLPPWPCSSFTFSVWVLSSMYTCNDGASVASSLHGLSGSDGRLRIKEETQFTLV